MIRPKKKSVPDLVSVKKIQKQVQITKKSLQNHNKPLIEFTLMVELLLKYLEENLSVSD